jgi:hypothetical protein
MWLILCDHHIIKPLRQRDELPEFYQEAHECMLVALVDDTDEKRTVERRIRVRDCDSLALFDTPKKALELLSDKSVKCNATWYSPDVHWPVFRATPLWRAIQKLADEGPCFHPSSATALAFSPEFWGAPTDFIMMLGHTMTKDAKPTLVPIYLSEEDRDSYHRQLERHIDWSLVQVSYGDLLSLPAAEDESDDGDDGE